MAVEIDIEGQRVVISDVATEATLQKLVDRLGGPQSQFGDAALKAAQQFGKQQRENTNQGRQATVQIKSLGKQAGDTATELDRAADASRGFADKFTGFFTKIANAGTSIVKFGAGVQGTGMNMKQVGDGVEQLGSSLGPIGTALGALGGAMIAHTANLIDTFQGLAGTGAMFTNNLFELENVAAKSYLSLDEMVGLIRENSEALSVFGGSAKLGAARFSELNMTMQRTYRDELRMLGLNAKDSAEMLASYTTMQATNTSFAVSNTKQQAAAANNFAKEITLLASLTGQDRKRLADEMKTDKLRADVKLKISRMGETEAKNTNAMLAMARAQFGEGSAELDSVRSAIMGYSVAQTNEARKLEAMSPEWDSFIQGIRSGTISTGEQFRKEMMTRASGIIEGLKPFEGIAQYSPTAMLFAESAAKMLPLQAQNLTLQREYGGNWEKFVEASKTKLDQSSKNIIDISTDIEDAGKSIRLIANQGAKLGVEAIAGVAAEIRDKVNQAFTDPDYAKKLKEATSTMSGLAGSSKALGTAFDLLKTKIGNWGAGASASTDLATGGAGALNASKDAAKKLAAEGAEKSVGMLAKFSKFLGPAGALLDGIITGVDASTEGKTTGEAVVEGTTTGIGSLAGMGAGAGIAGLLALSGPVGWGIAAALGIGGSLAGGYLGEKVGESFGSDIAKFFGFAEGGIVKQPVLGAAIAEKPGTTEGVFPLEPDFKSSDLSELKNIPSIQRGMGELASAMASMNNAEMLSEMKKFNDNINRLRRVVA